MDKKERKNIFKCFGFRMIVLTVTPIIILIFALVDIIFLKGSLNNAYSLWQGCFDEYFTFSTETMQVIWGIQTTLTGVVTAVCTYFFDKANERRLGFSFKYLYFQNSIFGKNNVFYLTVMNIFSLLCGGVYCYLFTGVNYLILQHVIKFLFLLNVGIQLLQLIQVLYMFGVSRYKESIVYERLQKLVDTEKTEEFMKYFLEGAPADYQQTLKLEGYNQYFEDEVCTLVSFYENLKAQKNKDLEQVFKKQIMENIAVKLYQRAISFGCPADKITLNEFDSFMDSLMMGAVNKTSGKESIYNFLKKYKDEIEVVLINLQPKEQKVHTQKICGVIKYK